MPWAFSSKDEIRISHLQANPTQRNIHEEQEIVLSAMIRRSGMITNDTIVRDEALTHKPLVVEGIVALIRNYSVYESNLNVLATKRSLTFVTWVLLGEFLSRRFTFTLGGPVLTDSDVKLTRERRDVLGRGPNGKLPSEGLTVSIETLATGHIKSFPLVCAVDQSGIARLNLTGPDGGDSVSYHADGTGTSVYEDLRLIKDWLSANGYSPRQPQHYIVVGRPYDIDLREDAVQRVKHQVNDREVAASIWEWQGRQEFMSVASFSKLSLELLQLGAPVDLIAACHVFARDELVHAQICSFMAKVLRERDKNNAVPWTLKQLFLDCKVVGAHNTMSNHALDLNRKRINIEPWLKDVVSGGCIGEGVSACVSYVQYLNFNCETSDDDFVAEKLLSIAKDEINHCMLGWRVVFWALGSMKEEAKFLVDDQWWDGMLRGWCNEMDEMIKTQKENSIGRMDLIDYGVILYEKQKNVGLRFWEDVVRPCVRGGRNEACVRIAFAKLWRSLQMDDL